MKIGNSDIINSLQPLKNNCYNCAVVVLLCRQKAAKLTEWRRDYVMAASAAAGTGEKRRKVREKYESWTVDTYKVILCKSCCGIFTQSFLPFLIICMLLKIVFTKLQILRQLWTAQPAPTSRNQILCVIKKSPAPQDFIRSDFGRHTYLKKSLFSMSRAMMANIDSRM